MQNISFHFFLVREKFHASIQCQPDISLKLDFVGARQVFCFFRRHTFFGEYCCHVSLPIVSKGKCHAFSHLFTPLSSDTLANNGTLVSSRIASQLGPFSQRQQPVPKWTEDQRYSRSSSCSFAWRSKMGKSWKSWQTLPFPAEICIQKGTPPSQGKNK